MKSVFLTYRKCSTLSIETIANVHSEVVVANSCDAIVVKQFNVEYFSSTLYLSKHNISLFMLIPMLTVLEFVSVLFCSIFVAPG